MTESQDTPIQLLKKYLGHVRVNLTPGYTSLGLVILKGHRGLSQLLQHPELEPWSPVGFLKEGEGSHNGEAQLCFEKNSATRVRDSKLQSSIAVSTYFCRRSSATDYHALVWLQREKLVLLLWFSVLQSTLVPELTSTTAI